MSEYERQTTGPSRRFRRLPRGGLITLLVILNVAFAATLLASAFRLPSAFAQAGLKQGEFICATAGASGFSYDVLYIIDLADHRLHAFYPGLPKTRQLVHAPSRDLYVDFAKDQGP